MALDSRDRRAADASVGSDDHRRGGMLGFTLAAMASAGVSAWLLGRAVHRVSGNRLEPWIVGRAAGITAYLLFVATVLMGLVLAHPWRAKIRVPGVATRIRIHIGLAIFTLCFAVLHIVVLATDKYAGVGWVGAFVPMGASYRPLDTTLGLIGLWAGLLIGVSAALAGYLPHHLWYPIHKVASLSLVLIWLHGVLGGSDTRRLASLYVITGMLVVGVAVTRYTARSKADLVAELKS